MLRGLQGWHLIIVVVLFVVLFGAKKLPDSAKSIAKSLKIFKSEMKDGEPKGDTPKTDS
ncbi:TatA Sec-independent protein secretion pathway components [actinobacterium SCGC AAA044-D11]|jgi:sec-independent protein translocase protein TatA